MTDRSAPVAVALARQMLGAAGPESAYVADSLGIFALGRSPDALEEMRSFLEKRAPHFSLRVSTDLPPVFPAPGD